MKSAMARTIAIALLVSAVLALPAAAGQRMGLGPGGSFHQLGQLKRALETAGAPALTAAQETSIKDLIANFRSTQQPPVAPDPAVAAARTAYQNAVLAGKLNDALAQARTIAGHMAANTAARLQAVAGFAVNAVQALDPAQVNALVAKFGAARVVQMIESLAGGPGMGGGLRGGAGPAMMRPHPPGR